MTTDTEDRSTWPRNGQVIRRAELLRLIEENGGPEGLDLRGATFVGNGPSDEPGDNPIDLTPKALAPLAAACGQAKGGCRPAWFWPRGGVNLRATQLQRARLVGAQLQAADLIGSELQGADLEGAELQGAFLSDAQLQHANLEGAQLGGADLQRAHLKGADLLEAELRGADLRSAELDEADLSDAQLERALLCGAELEGAILSYAQLEGADLRGATLHGAALYQARLPGADLRGAQLQGLDMYDVHTLDGARWYGAELDHARIKRESLGKAVGDEKIAHGAQERKRWHWDDAEDKVGSYHRAKEAYLLLKNNFNQIGRYEDASWAYVKEQQMEKMAYYWEHRWRLLRRWWVLRRWRLLFRKRYLRENGWGLWWLLRRGAWDAFWRWMRNWAYELATGYGERPWNPIMGGLLAIVGFAGGFCTTRAIGNFWDALVYSIATFATFNLARL
jgi:uncharacterized protein YjbI with pentapeptide repeats